jgi:hypothetical protein
MRGAHRTEAARALVPLYTPRGTRAVEIPVRLRDMRILLLFCLMLQFSTRLNSSDEKAYRSVLISGKNMNLRGITAGYGKGIESERRALEPPGRDCDLDVWHEREDSALGGQWQDLEGAARRGRRDAGFSRDPIVRVKDGVRNVSRH